MFYGVFEAEVQDQQKPNGTQNSCTWGLKFRRNLTYLFSFHLQQHSSINIDHDYLERYNLLSVFCYKLGEYGVGV